MDVDINLWGFSLADFHTQLWIHEDEGKWFELGELNSGEIMDLDISGLSFLFGVDCYILDENQSQCEHLQLSSPFLSINQFKTMRQYMKDTVKILSNLTKKDAERWLVFA